MSFQSGWQRTSRLVLVWSRLYFDLEPYLTERDAHGTPVLNFYHRQFGEAAAAAFLNGDGRAHAHSHLAEYFQGQDYFREALDAQRTRAQTVPPTPRPVNVRKVDELPWQRLEAAKLRKQWEELEGLFTELPFVEAKAEAGMVFDLLTDFTAAAAALPRERPKRRHLSLIAEAIGRDIHFISVHPTTLFQCLWNLCRWYDSPDGAHYYDPPLKGWPAEGPPWKCPEGERVSSSISSWRARKEQWAPGFPWLRALRPPSTPLAAGLLRGLSGHNSYVNCVAFDPLGRRVASGSSDDTVRVWDADTGEPLMCLSGHCESVHGLAFDPTGRWITSGSFDRTVVLWDAATGDAVKCLRGHSDQVTCVAFSREGDRIASGSMDGTICIWHADSGKLLARVGRFGGVTNVAFFPNGAQLILVELNRCAVVVARAASCLDFS